MWDLRGPLQQVASANSVALQRRLGCSDAGCSFRAAVESLIRSAPDGWYLYHPVVNYLRAPGTWEAEVASSRDLQLVFWLGSHNWADAAIGLDVARDTTVWSWCGSRQLGPGHYSVSRFRDEIATPQVAWDIAGLCAVGPREDMWPHGDEAVSRDLRASLANTLAVLDEFQSGFPRIFDWAAHATRVIVPLRPRPDGRVRSGSLAEEVGTVYLDLSSPVSFLESLVHESAHQHFYLYEHLSVLVSADGTPSFYSPLKKMLRPLRGVFLAYHALACIAQLYRELLLDRAFDEASMAPALDSVLSDLEVAATGMRSGQAHLTEAGWALFEQIECRRALLSL